MSYTDYVHRYKRSATACHQAIDSLSQMQDISDGLDTNPDNIFILYHRSQDVADVTEEDDDEIVLMMCDLGFPNDAIYQGRDA